MAYFTRHPSDRELVCALDGEVSARRSAKIAAHLLRCDACQARMASLEAATTDVVRTYRRELDTAPTSIHEERARLQSAMAGQAGEASRREHLRGWRASLSGAPMAYAGAALLIAALGAQSWWQQRSVPRLVASAVEPGALPLTHLTPGATRPIDRDEVCGDREHPSPAVPSSVRLQILRDYNMLNVPDHEYELDYLITPELGGSDDPRNLWPERYSSGVWNARVKDELEDLLPRLVCEGTLALAVAQRDMASDWIAAYKKYFRTDRPVRPTWQRPVGSRRFSRAYARLGTHVFPDTAGRPLMFARRSGGATTAP